MSEEAKKYLTTAEVAARFEGAISIRTLNNWRSQGNGPEFIKLGGKVVYPVEKLIQWEQKNTVTSTSQYRS